jgi:hypothetical protein
MYDPHSEGAKKYKEFAHEFLISNGVVSSLNK